MSMKEKSGKSCLLFFMLLLLAACQRSGSIDNEKLVYACPMHPEIESREEGQCPICKMTLVLKSPDLSNQLASPAKRVLSDQSTVRLMARDSNQLISASGYIDLDQNRSESVSARFGGRIEKLYVKYELQYVKKGEKIMELYSPELNSYQEEHLLLLRSASTNSLLEQSRNKLKLLGLSANQVAELESKGKFTRSVSVYSPVSGYVLFNQNKGSEKSMSNTGNSSMKGMGMVPDKVSAKNYSTSTDQIREGIYINKGDVLFSVNDLQTVWAIISIPDELHSFVADNSLVSIVSELLPDRKLSGKVLTTEQIYMENEQSFGRIRVALNNKDKKLKINSLLTAELELKSHGSFQIPSTAVYRTGMATFVWVKTGTTEKGTGVFELRKVNAGITVDGYTSIFEGLSANEEIAEYAGFMVDSETFLNTD